MGNTAWLPKPKMKSNFLLVAAILFFSTALLVVQSCRKLDTLNQGETNTQAILQRFFNLPSHTDPATQKAMAALQRKESAKPFAARMAIKDGYPLWERSIVQYGSYIKYSNAQFYRSSSNTNDTLVIIPLVLNGTTYVHAYIAAYIHDSVYLSMNRGEDYRNYPLGNINVPDSVMTGEKIALQFMALNKQVFGDSVYRITDNRLFPKHDPTRVVKNRRITIKSNPATAGRLVLVSYQHCVPYEDEEEYDNPFGVNVSNGQGGDWTNTVIRYNCTTMYMLVDDGTDPPFPQTGGGNNTGGGGGPTTGTCNPTPTPSTEPNPNSPATTLGFEPVLVPIPPPQINADNAITDNPIVNCVYSQLKSSGVLSDILKAFEGNTYDIKFILASLPSGVLGTTKYLGNNVFQCTIRKEDAEDQYFSRL